jgi:uncharacterized protein (TIGR02231 family)
MKVQTAITAVAVYTDRARITRTGTETLEPGSHRLVIDELPLKLDAASVRAAARGTARARLLGVDVQREFFVETPVEHVRELEEQIEAVEDEMRGLDAHTKLLEQERVTLGELAGQTEMYARGLAYGRIDAGTQMALLNDLRARSEEVNGALLEKTVRRRELERRLKKLRGELEQKRGARGRERYAAVIEVDVTQAGDLSVELTYVVSGAGWKPLYDMRLLEQEGEKSVLEVGYLAQVTQQTGEDWQGVALTLSTARPALVETLPELDPWYVSPIVMPRPTARRAAKMAAPAPAFAAQDTLAGAGMELAAAVVAEAEVEVPMATVQTTGAAVTYQVPGAVTVPADGAPHKVSVARLELMPMLDYVTAPKLVEAAYRRAKVANDSPYTFLPGPVNLFAGDEFVGTTELELTAPNGELELYLGTDDRVKVERELKRREVDKKLIRDRRRLQYGYEITVENLLAAEAKVTLHDQIPVPRHEDIKVKLESVEPRPSEQTELNLLDWELTLGAGEKATVRFDFTVDHPREMRVAGLP